MNIADIRFGTASDESDHEGWDVFQKTMDEISDAANEEVKKLAQLLGISEQLGSEIWYLRTRSRHSYRTEQRMIKCYRETGTEDFRCLAGEEEDALTEHGY